MVNRLFALMDLFFLFFSDLIHSTEKGEDTVVSRQEQNEIVNVDNAFSKNAEFKVLESGYTVDMFNIIVFIT